MMRFTLGLAIIVFTLIIGGYNYFENVKLLDAKQRGLDDVENQLREAQELQNRVQNIRKTSMLMGDDQKFTLERMLDIGAPGLEFRFVGQPRYAGSNRALFRHTFRVTGPADFATSVGVLKKMATLPGFTPYQYCFGCVATPKGTPAQLKMVQIEGYLYVYDANLL
ncbi:MAG: hypothetical protein WAX89_04535 [Alphaproteobacteria bacterium]